MAHWCLEIANRQALSETFYEQLCSERVIIRQVGGKPTKRFERIKGMDAEALDSLTYAIAAKSALTLTGAAFDQRLDELKNTPVGKELVKEPVRYAVDNWLGAERGNLRGDWNW